MQFNQKAFGERVRNARKSCGFTQEALANSLSRASLSSLSSEDKVGSADKSLVVAGVVIRRIIPDLNGLLIVVTSNCRDLTKYCKPFAQSF